VGPAVAGGDDDSLMEGCAFIILSKLRRKVPGRGPQDGYDGNSQRYQGFGAAWWCGGGDGGMGRDLTRDLISLACDTIHNLAAGQVSPGLGRCATGPSSRRVRADSIGPIRKGGAGHERFDGRPADRAARFLQYPVVI
jgi:hypothetical protein